MLLTSIMTHTVFPNVGAATLFNFYTNAAKHAQVTGAPAMITDKLGEPFNLYDGYCFGENLHLELNKLIVQAWRTNNWPPDVDDSIVVLRFVEENNDMHLYLTHADVPVSMADALRQGWHDFYWVKWRQYLTLYNAPIIN
jgi:activator of HSP90 ATPase